MRNLLVAVLLATLASSLVEASCPALKSSSLDYRCALNDREVSCDSNVTENTIATPRCKENYRLPDTYIKHAQITCLSSGQWSGKFIECSPTCGKGGSRLSNGPTEVKRGEVPWQVGLYMRKMPDGSISNTWTLLCGGTLINSHIVLTAAHCLKYGIPDAALRPDEIKVGLGKIQRTITTLEPGSIISNVREVILSPHYIGEATSYIEDLALLNLVQPVQLSEYIIPACVDWSNIFKMATGERVQVSGWGRNDDGIQSEVLLATEMKFVESLDCIAKFPHSLQRYITPDKFCGESETGAGTLVTIRSSGGGMTVVKDDRHFVIGIVSTKVSRNDKLNMFTNISNVEHLSWLESQRARLDSRHRNQN